MGVLTGIPELDSSLSKRVLQLNGAVYSGKTGFALNRILFHNTLNLGKRVLFLHPNLNKARVTEILAVEALKDRYGVNLSEEDILNYMPIGLSLIEDECQFEVSNTVLDETHYDLIILDFEEEDDTGLLNLCDNLVVIRNQLELFINPEYDILSIDRLNSTVIITDLNHGNKHIENTYIKPIGAVS